MKNKIALSLIALLFGTMATFAQTKKEEPTRYRAGINLNGLRIRTLELSGQATKTGKFIFNANVGYSYQNPRLGNQTDIQVSLDSIKASVKTSGVFVKAGVQANIFALMNKFTKGDLFIGTGLTSTYYNKATKFKDLSLPFANQVEINKTFKGISTAPYISAGANLRLMYYLYMDLGLQYTLTKAQSKDNLLPSGYDALPGMGPNFRKLNKTSLIATIRYEFPLKK